MGNCYTKSTRDTFTETTTATAPLPRAAPSPFPAATTSTPIIKSLSKPLVTQPTKADISSEQIFAQSAKVIISSNPDINVRFVFLIKISPSIGDSGASC